MSKNTNAIEKIICELRKRDYFKYSLSKIPLALTYW